MNLKSKINRWWNTIDNNTPNFIVKLKSFNKTRVDVIHKPAEDGFIYLNGLKVVKVPKITEDINDYFGIHEIREISGWFDYSEGTVSVWSTRYYSRRYYNGRWFEDPTSLSINFDEIRQANKVKEYREMNTKEYPHLFGEEALQEQEYAIDKISKEIKDLDMILLDNLEKDLQTVISEAQSKFKDK